MVTASTREHAEVELAFDTRRMGRLLADGVGLTGGPCHILDAKYEPGRHCSMLYQLDSTMILGMLGWGGVSRDHDRGRDLPTTKMRIYRWPHDPALATLPTVLGAGVLARALEQLLPGVERVVRCTVTPVRYRPARRCTLRVDARVLHGPGSAGTGCPPRTLYAKVYHDLNKARLAAATLRTLAETLPAISPHRGQLVVPQPVAFLPDLALVLCEPVIGTGLELLLGDRRHAVTSIPAAAGALAALHRADHLPAPTRTAIFELDQLTDRALRIREYDASLGARMADLTTILASCSPSAGEISVVHGDCKPSQFLIDPSGRAALLDLDSCRLADPAGDVGAFTATLRRGRVRARLRRQRHPSRLPDRFAASREKDFLDAYCLATGRGAGFRERVKWYEALALVRKAQRAFARAPRSPLPAAILTEASRCLREARSRR
ncbi:MAG: phosphotransferase [Egibacteraceae bacterium]